MTFRLDYKKLTLDGRPIQTQDIVALMSKLEYKAQDPKLRDQMKKLLDYWQSKEWKL